MGWRYGTLLRDGLLAGLTATTAMNLGYGAERRIRRNVKGPLDYDDSNVPALVAAKVLHQSDLSDDASVRLGLAVHWGYGSLFGLTAVPLHRRFGPVPATALYWSGMMAFACVMFPVLGGTPPPWRWRHDVIVTSAFQHLVYAGTATAVLQALTRRQRGVGRTREADVTRGSDGAPVSSAADGAGGFSEAAGTAGRPWLAGPPWLTGRPWLAGPPWLTAAVAGGTGVADGAAVAGGTGVADGAAVAGGTGVAGEGVA